MTSAARWCVVPAFGAVALLLLAARAIAHPEGSSSVDRYLAFAYEGGGRFRVAYVLDFAEAPAYAEIDAIDRDHDGALGLEEQRRYLDMRVSGLASAWTVEIDGVRVSPHVVASHLEVTPGQGGLETLRIASELEVASAAPPTAREVRLHVRDEAFEGRPGVRVIRVMDPSDDAGASSAPDGLTGSPRSRTDVVFTFHERTPAASRVSSRWLEFGALLLVAALFSPLAVSRLRRRR